MRKLDAWIRHLADQQVIHAVRRHTAQKRSVQRKRPGAAESDLGAAAIGNLLNSSITTPSRAFHRQQEEAALWRHLNELPADRRDLLVRRFMTGQSPKQIAAQLGKTEGAVRVMLTRATRQLRERMHAAQDGDSPRPGRNDTSPG